MTEVRRDSKNRKLFDGESQDGEGRYRYRYTDIDGKRKSVYSWRLTNADKIPPGTKDDDCLRNKEKEVHRRIESGVSTESSKITLYELTDKYLKSRTNLKPTTITEYTYAIGTVKDDPFTHKKIGSIKTSDVKLWLSGLCQNGKPISTTQRIKHVCTMAYKMALQDDLVVKNPFDFKYSDIISCSVNKRSAITPEQEHAFLDFIRGNSFYRNYYEPFYILFKTGLRISEFTGLTLSDIDFQNNMIHVTHQLQDIRHVGLRMLSPKSYNASRVIPMSSKVRECFSVIVDRRDKLTANPTVQAWDSDDVYDGLLFLTGTGKPTKSNDWESRFRNAVNAYNKTHDVPLPKISPHIARHTFCTNMMNAKVPPQYVQYLMGHSDVSVTLNTYTHVNPEDTISAIDLICTL